MIIAKRFSLQRFRSQKTCEVCWWRLRKKTDVNQISDYEKYRQIDFSSKDTVSIVQNGELSVLVSPIEKKIKEASGLTHYYELRVQKMKPAKGKILQTMLGVDFRVS